MLCECCRQVETEEVTKSRNKIHQAWGPPFSSLAPCNHKGASIGNPAFASTNKLLDENLIFCIENTANCRQSKAKNKLV